MLGAIKRKGVLTGRELEVVLLETRSAVEYDNTERTNVFSWSKGWG
jgi:hypothetical protein